MRLLHNPNFNLHIERSDGSWSDIKYTLMNSPGSETVQRISEAECQSKCQYKPSCTAFSYRILDSDLGKSTCILSNYAPEYYADYTYFEKKGTGSAAEVPLLQKPVLPASSAKPQGKTMADAVEDSNKIAARIQEQKNEMEAKQLTAQAEDYRSQAHQVTSDAKEFAVETVQEARENALTNLKAHEQAIKMNATATTTEQLHNMKLEFANQMLKDQRIMDAKLSNERQQKAQGLNASQSNVQVNQRAAAQVLAAQELEHRSEELSKKIASVAAQAQKVRESRDEVQAAMKQAEIAQEAVHSQELHAFDAKVAGLRARVHDVVQRENTKLLAFTDKQDADMAHQIKEGHAKQKAKRLQISLAKAEAASRASQLKQEENEKYTKAFKKQEMELKALEGKVGNETTLVQKYLGEEIAANSTFSENKSQIVLKQNRSLIDLNKKTQVELLNEERKANATIASLFNETHYQLRVARTATLESLTQSLQRHKEQTLHADNNQLASDNELLKSARAKEDLLDRKLKQTEIQGKITQASDKEAIANETEAAKQELTDVITAAKQEIHDIDHEAESRIHSIKAEQKKEHKRIIQLGVAQAAKENMKLDDIMHTSSQTMLLNMHAVEFIPYTRHSREYQLSVHGLTQQLQEATSKMDTAAEEAHSIATEIKQLRDEQKKALARLEAAERAQAAMQRAHIEVHVKNKFISEVKHTGNILGEGDDQEQQQQEPPRAPQVFVKEYASKESTRKHIERRQKRYQRTRSVVMAEDEDEKRWFNIAVVDQRDIKIRDEEIEMNSQLRLLRADQQHLREEMNHLTSKRQSALKKYQDARAKRLGILTTGPYQALGMKSESPMFTVHGDEQGAFIRISTAKLMQGDKIKSATLRLFKHSGVAANIVAHQVYCNFTKGTLTGFNSRSFRVGNESVGRLKISSMDQHWYEIPLFTDAIHSLPVNPSDICLEITGDEQMPQYLPGLKFFGSQPHVPSMLTRIERVESMNKPSPFIMLNGQGHVCASSSDPESILVTTTVFPGKSSIETRVNTAVLKCNRFCLRNNLCQACSLAEVPESDPPGFWKYKIVALKSCDVLIRGGIGVAGDFSKKALPGSTLPRAQQPTRSNIQLVTSATIGRQEAAEQQKDATVKEVEIAQGKMAEAEASGELDKVVQAEQLLDDAKQDQGGNKQVSDSGDKAIDTSPEGSDKAGDSKQAQQGGNKQVSDSGDKAIDTTPEGSDKAGSTNTADPGSASGDSDDDQHLTPEQQAERVKKALIAKFTEATTKMIKQQLDEQMNRDISKKVEDQLPAALAAKVDEQLPSYKMALLKNQSEFLWGSPLVALQKHASNVLKRKLKPQVYQELRSEITAKEKPKFEHRLSEMVKFKVGMYVELLTAKAAAKQLASTSDQARQAIPPAQVLADNLEVLLLEESETLVPTHSSVHK